MKDIDSVKVEEIEKELSDHFSMCSSFEASDSFESEELGDDQFESSPTFKKLTLRFKESSQADGEE